MRCILCKHISAFIWLCFGEKVLYNVHYHCNKKDSSIFGAASCDMIICFAHEFWLSVLHVVLWNVSSPLAWAQSCCGLSVHYQLAEPHWSQSAVEINHNWTQLGSTELMEMRWKCSYASCDGPVHCLLCFISLVLYLIPTSILYENAPFGLIKVCFLRVFF